MSESDKKAGHREELRQRFLDGDAASRTDEALLELLLTYAIPRKDVRPIASRLISEFGSVSDALAAPTKTLTQVDGIGAHSAALLKLVDWLREGPPTSGEQKEVATSPKPEQGTLFGDSAEEKPLPSAKRPASGKKTTARQGTGLFGKALLKEAIALLPELPDTTTSTRRRPTFALICTTVLRLRDSGTQPISRGAYSPRERRTCLCGSSQNASRGLRISVTHASTAL